MSTQDILNISLATGLLVIAACIVFITYYSAQALKSFTRLSDSIEDTVQNVRSKLQMKALTVIPALVIALISKIFKKGR